MDSGALSPNPSSLMRTETSFRRSRKYTPLDRGHKCGFSSQTTITRCRERRVPNEQRHRPLDPFSVSMWYCQWRRVSPVWRLTRSNAALSLSFSLFFIGCSVCSTICIDSSTGNGPVWSHFITNRLYYPSSINVNENETAAGSISMQTCTSVKWSAQINYPVFVYKTSKLKHLE